MTKQILGVRPRMTTWSQTPNETWGQTPNEKIVQSEVDMGYGNIRIGSWFLVLLFIIIIANICPKNMVDYILTWLSLKTPNDFTVMLITAIICILAGVNWLKIPRFSYKHHYMIALTELVIFMPILFFLGLIAIHYFGHENSRYANRSIPWVGIAILFWNLHSSAIEYFRYKRKNK